MNKNVFECYPYNNRGPMAAYTDENENVLDVIDDLLNSYGLTWWLSKGYTVRLGLELVSKTKYGYETYHLAISYDEEEKCLRYDGWPMIFTKFEGRPIGHSIFVESIDWNNRKFEQIQ